MCDNFIRYGIDVEEFKNGKEKVFEFLFFFFVGLFVGIVDDWFVFVENGAHNRPTPPPKSYVRTHCQCRTNDMGCVAS